MSFIVTGTPYNGPRGALASIALDSRGNVAATARKVATSSFSGSSSPDATASACALGVNRTGT
jgi:hypothetical protein